jgi:hypothetical protein
MLAVGVVAVLASAAVPAFGQATSKTPTYAPVSGPPGTVVNVSGITLCDNQQPRVTGGQIGFGLDRASVHTPPSFTPPTASITIPDVPNGDYNIFLFCGSVVESFPFTVTGSTVAPRVIVGPTLAG